MRMDTSWPHADTGTSRAERKAHTTLADIQAHAGRERNTTLKTKSHRHSLKREPYVIGSRAVDRAYPRHSTSAPLPLAAA